MLMLSPGALSLASKQAVAAANGETMGGDGMDGPMQMPEVAGSRHFSKKQVTQGLEAVEEEVISATHLLAVPIIAIVLCSAAYFLIMTENGREFAKDIGLIHSSSWAKMEMKTSQDGGQEKWYKMSLEAPLVVEAMQAMGMKSKDQQPGEQELKAFSEQPQESLEDDWEPQLPKRITQESNPEAFFKPEDEFVSNAQASEQAEVVEEEEFASEQQDLMQMEEDDLIQMEPSTAAAAPIEDDTTAAFMANRGAAMSPEELLKSLSTPEVEPVQEAAPSVESAPVELDAYLSQPEAAPVVDNAPNDGFFNFGDDDFLQAEKVTDAPAPAPTEAPTEVAPVIEKISAGFSFDDDEFLGQVSEAPAPAPADTAPVFEKVAANFNFDDEDDFP